ncbi:MAG: hypothetical protein KJ023_14175, partial [Burkholderiaceae bacterium]|nr:hypothetical protein [Burkholderiaceae bacterium]
MTRLTQHLPAAARHSATRQSATRHSAARHSAARLAPLATLLLTLTGCASFSPDGGFAAVQKAAADRLGTPAQLVWARQPEDLDRIAERVGELL